MAEKTELEGMSRYTMQISGLTVTKLIGTDKTCIDCSHLMGGFVASAKKSYGPGMSWFLSQ